MNHLMLLYKAEKNQISVTAESIKHEVTVRFTVVHKGYLR